MMGWLEQAIERGLIVEGFGVRTEAFTEKRIVGIKLTEAEFQQQVIDLAQRCGYKVAHFRKVRVQRGDSTYWETPVAADGTGFPDLIIVGFDRILAWELKVRPNKATAEQLEWLRVFGTACFNAGVYYPEDWDRMKAMLEGKRTDSVAVRGEKA